MEGGWDPEERKTREAEIKNLTTKIDSYSRLHNHVQCLSAEIQYRAKHYLQKIWTCSHSEPYYPQRGDLQLQSQMCRAEPLPRQGHQRTKLLICGDERDGLWFYTLECSLQNTKAFSGVLSKSLHLNSSTFPFHFLLLSQANIAELSWIHCFQ